MNKLLTWMFPVMVVGCCLSSYTVAPAQSLEEFDRDYLEAPAEGPELGEAVDIILQQTNAVRTEHERPPVEVNEQLTETARYFAAYMARTGEYGHTADENRPAQRASLFDYDYCLVSENIAQQFKPAGFTTQELGQSFYEGWLNSPEHRENMLHPYVIETGVAIGFDEESGHYFAVQMFGRPKSAAYRFQITNRSDENVSYSLQAAGSESAEAREFELPPRVTRTHMRCRPAEIAWGWNATGDYQAVENDQALVVTSRGNQLSVESAGSQ